VIKKTVKIFKTLIKRKNSPIFLSILLLAVVIPFFKYFDQFYLIALVLTVIAQSLLCEITTFQKARLNFVRLDWKNFPESKIYRQAAGWISVIPLIVIFSLKYKFEYIKFIIILLIIINIYAFFKISAASTINRYRIKKSVRQLNNLNPEIVIHLSGAKDSAYQINQWLDVFEKFDFRFVIIARQFHHIFDIKQTKIPAFLATDQRALEYVSESGVKIVLYAANSVKNSEFFRMIHLKHVFINHGESDKVVNQSKYLMAYDKLFVAGQMAEDRMRSAGLELRPKQVVHVGRPQVELELNKGEEKNKAVKFLYAPTWEGFAENANYSSVNQLGFDIIEALIKIPNVEIRFKPHPFTGRESPVQREFLNRIKVLLENNKFEVVGSEHPIYYHMNWSDVLVCDVSSVLNDYLATEKPILISNPKSLPVSEMYENFPSCKAAYIINNGDDVINSITSIRDRDPLKYVRQGVSRYSLGDFPGGSNLKFSNELRNLLAE
jgi:CDP-glycerol glycerophosphotransferase (TagB/SpsB family)